MLVIVNILYIRVRLVGSSGKNNKESVDVENWQIFNLHYWIQYW